MLLRHCSFDLTIAVLGPCQRFSSLFQMRVRASLRRRMLIWGGKIHDFSAEAVARSEACLTAAPSFMILIASGCSTSESAVLVLKAVSLGQMGSKASR
jgi:hypothetical protein